MPSNYLFQQLSAPSCARLLDRCQLVDLRPRQILTDRCIMQCSAYFLEDGAVACQAKVGEATFAGFGLVGKAGMVGLTALLGASVGPFRTTSLCAGRAYRIEARALKELMREEVDVSDVLLNFAHVQLVVAGQIAACNALHSAEERLSRWLLTACYVTGLLELPFSQETLSGLLGLRRPTVTTALQHLREEGIVDVQRRKVTILDLDQLESVSCRCHRPIRKQIRTLVPSRELDCHPALLPTSERRRIGLDCAPLSA